MTFITTNVDSGAFYGMCTQQTSEFIFLFISYFYQVVLSEFLQSGFMWSQEPGKVIFGHICAIVWSVWISLMAYTRDQLINFRPSGALTVSRSVRKTLFRLHLWNPICHRLPKISGPPPRGTFPGIPVGDASRVHVAPTTSVGQSPGGVSSRISTTLRQLSTRRPLHLPATVLSL